MFFSSFLAGTMILTKGSELFDKSAELDDITLSIDWYEKEDKDEKEEDKEIGCLAIFNPRSIAGVR
jgi:hypothetical protein